ncbi:MAG: hypothetical protein IKU17_09425 [Clostridia bacterium]|nr:hypothetical protein [Clostridia bacterium]
MKKLLILIMVCLLFFTMTGMEPEPAGPTKEEIQEDIKEWFVEMTEFYKESDPEKSAYYAKWSQIDIPDPYPAEWQNKDGTMKDFVTTQMLYDAFYNSLQYQFIMEDPDMQRGWNASVNIYMDAERRVHMTTGVVTYQAKYAEDGTLIEEKGTK